MRRPTPDDPLRVLFSACLLGQPVGWEGGPYTHPQIVALAQLPVVRALPFCPEHVTLGTPRLLTTVRGGDGHDVWAGRAQVRDSEDVDRTPALLQGARAMLAHAQRARAELAILTEISDSCGTGVLYDGPPERQRYRKGPGVANALLQREGLPIVSSRDAATLDRLRAHLDPAHSPREDLTDYEDDPWYVGYFGPG